METFLDTLRRHGEKRPDASAIAATGQQPLNYGEFLKAALAVKHVLNGAGFGPDDRIALRVPDGPQMLFGIFAIGCAAQALPTGDNTTEPEFRDIIKRAACRCLIHDADIDPLLLRAAKAEGLLCLPARRQSDDPSGLWRIPDTDTRNADGIRDPGLDDTAFIMISSGTTGRPKLVPRTHGNLSFCDAVLEKDLPLGPSDIALTGLPQHQSMGSIGTLHPCIRVGGMASCKGGPFIPGSFVDQMNEIQPTYFSGGPVYLHAILNEARNRDISAGIERLRFIRAGTDSVNAELRRAITELFGVPIHASYGMSETGPIAHRSSEEESDPPGFIGRLLIDDVAVLDEAGNVAPPGEQGEICARGPSITSHYVGDDALNAEIFVDGWFHTGDLGVIGDEGRLCYAGRKKELINRGGFKVAPLEVERALISHPAIAEAAVFPIDHPTLGQEVALAVVLEPGQDFDEQSLSDHLTGKLSPDKWPRRLFRLDALPLNDNNKVQRSDLTAMFSGADETPERTAVNYPDSLTAAVAGIWGHVLRTRTVAPDGNFVSVGGDSLQAVILQSEIVHVFGVEVAIDDILGPDCSPATMAETIRGAGTRSPPDITPPNESVQEATLLPTPAQKSLFTVGKLTRGAATPVVVCGFQIEGVVNETALLNAIRTLLERHDGLRLRFVLDDKDVRMTIDPVTDIVLETVDGKISLDAVAADLVRRAADIDLENGNSRKLVLYRQDSSHALFCIVVHHALFDGLSTNHLADDFATLYLAACSNRPSNLPSPESFADFIKGYHQTFNDAGKGAAERRLHSRLAPPPPPLMLFPKPDNPAPSMERVCHTVPLDPAAVSRLVSRYAAHGITPFMALTAVFCQQIAKSAPLGDRLVAVPLGNRGLAHATKTVGCLMHAAPFRLPLSHADDANALRDAVRHELLATLETGSLPLETLVERKILPNAGLFRAAVPITFQVRDAEPELLVDTPELRIRRADPPIGVNNLSHAAIVIRTGNKPSIRFEADSGLTDIPAMLEFFNDMAVSIAESP